MDVCELNDKDEPVIGGSWADRSPEQVKYVLMDLVPGVTDAETLQECGGDLAGRCMQQYEDACGKMSVSKSSKTSQTRSSEVLREELACRESHETAQREFKAALQTILKAILRKTILPAIPRSVDTIQALRKHVRTVYKSNCAKYQDEYRNNISEVVGKTHKEGQRRFEKRMGGDSEERSDHRGNNRDGAKPVRQVFGGKYTDPYQHRRASPSKGAATPDRRTTRYQTRSPLNARSENKSTSRGRQRDTDNSKSPRRDTDAGGNKSESEVCGVGAAKATPTSRGCPSESPRRRVGATSHSRERPSDADKSESPVRRGTKATQKTRGCRSDGDKCGSPARRDAKAALKSLGPRSGGDTSEPPEGGAGDAPNTSKSRTNAAKGKSPARERKRNSLESPPRARAALKRLRSEPATPSAVDLAEITSLVKDCPVAATIIKGMLEGGTSMKTALFAAGVLHSEAMLDQTIIRDAVADNWTLQDIGRSSEFRARQIPYGHRRVLLKVMLDVCKMDADQLACVSTAVVEQGGATTSGSAARNDVGPASNAAKAADAVEVAAVVEVEAADGKDGGDHGENDTHDAGEGDTNAGEGGADAGAHGAGDSDAGASDGHDSAADEMGKSESDES